jgi:hypothetical protein
VVSYLWISLLFVANHMLSKSKSIILHVAYSFSPLHQYGLRPILHAKIANSMCVIIILNEVMIMSVLLRNNWMNFCTKLPFCPNDRSCPFPLASITTTLHHIKQALAHANSNEMKTLQAYQGFNDDIIRNTRFLVPSWSHDQDIQMKLSKIVKRNTVDENI